MHTTHAHSTTSALIASLGAAAPGAAAGLAAPAADGLSFVEHLGRSAGAGLLEAADAGALALAFATEPGAGPDAEPGLDPVADANPDLDGLRDFLAQLLPNAAATDAAVRAPVATGSDGATQLGAEPGEPIREARNDAHTRGAPSRRVHAESALARGALRLTGEAQANRATPGEGPARDAASPAQPVPGAKPGPAETSTAAPEASSVVQAAALRDALPDTPRADTDSAALAAPLSMPAAQSPARPAEVAAAARGPAASGRAGIEASPWRATPTALPGSSAARPGAAGLEPAAERAAAEQGTRAGAGKQPVAAIASPEAMPQAAALVAPQADSPQRTEVRAAAAQRTPDGVAPIATLSTPGAAPALPGAAVAPLHLELAVPVAAPQFREAFALQVSMLARDGVQHAVMQLNPAEMGPISVQIALDGQQAQIHFGSDSAHTRQLVEAGLPALAAALRESGLTLSGGGVSQHAPEPRQGSSGTAAAPRQATAPEPEPTPVLRSVRVVNGRLDTYA